MSQCQEEFIFTWTQQNYFFCDYERQKVFYSPNFETNIFHERSWVLEFIHGGGCSSFDFVSLVLFLTEDAELVINFTIELCNDVDEVFAFAEMKGVRLQCENSHNYYPIVNIISIGELEEKMKNSSTVDLLVRFRMTGQKSGTPKSPSRNSCTAITEISFDMFSFVLELDSYPPPSWLMERTFTIDDRRQLLVTLEAPQNDYLIKIKQVEGKFSFLKIKCEIHLLNKEGKELVSACDVFTFKKQDSVWNFAPFFKKPLSGDCYLKFNFSMSNGFLFTEIIDYTLRPNLLSPCKKSKDITAISCLLDALHSTLFNNELADVKFRIENEIIGAHKCILASWSPVFSTMFKQKMLENETGEIVITDMDEQTLRLFLEFLYTGEIERVDVERALDLLLAAEKYQVSSLKEKCTEYLKKNLTTDNVCSVASVADMVGDQSLKKASFDYMKENGDEILSSPKWLTFISENAVLCSEILSHISKHFKTFYKK